MINITLSDFARYLGYEYMGVEGVFFNKIVIDSRKIKDGDLFVAAKGEQTDGHLYIEEALKNGAVGVLSIAGDNKVLFDKTNYMIGKNDTLEEFFFKTAKMIREKTKAKVIGITGSVGKTTTKDMLYSVLSQESKAIKTEGNYNNELGLPITMSCADEDTSWMILEMGMRGQGEIRYLSEIAKPDYAIITSIEPVHAELLGSLENIAKAKAEIAELLPESGCLVINDKDKHILMPYLQQCKSKIITIGFAPEADYVIKEIVSEEESGTEYILLNNQKEFQVKINSIGRHNVQNSAMVIALCNHIGIDESSFSALKHSDFSEMRFHIKKISGIKIINDAYNANPSSTGYSLESVGKVTGDRRIFIFGDMFELGEYEKEGHEKVAEKIIEAGIDLVFLIGEKVKYTNDKLSNLNYNMDNVFLFTDRDDLFQKIKPILKKGDILLLKASRGMCLEKIEKKIEEYLHVL